MDIESANSAGPSDPQPGPQNVAGDRIPASIRCIALTGFMAAGKTTVGRLLAGRLGWQFKDVDDEIESTTGLSVPEIFRIHGEASFREREHQSIVALLSGVDLVLSMGGGAIEDQRTRELLLQTKGIRLVYLDASLQTSLNRCGRDEQAITLRPVLADRANLEARYQLRLPYYRQSHHHVGVDDLAPEAVVDQILQQLTIARP